MTAARAFAGCMLAILTTGCAIEDSHVAERAQSKLLRMPEVDLETCLGAPDQHQSFGDVDVLTYYTTSSSSTSWQLPLIQGPSFTNGGNCHMTIRFDNGLASRILYSGEKNATGSPDAYCAPIVRTCLAALDRIAREKGSSSPEP